MIKLMQLAAVVALTASLVGCSRDKGADLAACRIEADKAFPAFDEVAHPDRVVKCMRVKGWEFNIYGGLNAPAPRTGNDCTDKLGHYDAYDEKCYKRVSSLPWQ